MKKYLLAGVAAAGGIQRGEAAAELFNGFGDKSRAIKAGHDDGYFGRL